MEQSPSTGSTPDVVPPLDGEIVSSAALVPAPPPLDDDEDVVDAEIVEIPSASPYSALAPDYSEAGVPSLNYVRDKIEGRFATASGSAELAQAEAQRSAIARAAAQQQAAITAEQQRVAREQAGRDKLEEIRRQLHPEG